MEYFCWFDANGDAITRPTEINDPCEAAAEMESRPDGAVYQRTDTKENLIKAGLSPEDFDE